MPDGIEGVEDAEGNWSRGREWVDNKATYLLFTNRWDTPLGNLMRCKIHGPSNILQQAVTRWSFSSDGLMARRDLNALKDNGFLR